MISNLIVQGLFPHVLQIQGEHNASKQMITEPSAQAKGAVVGKQMSMRSVPWALIQIISIRSAIS